MRVSNIGGMWAWRRLESVNYALMNLAQQLATARRIPSARFDVAGAAIAARMRSQVEGYGKALDNVYYGMNLLRTAEGGMASIQDRLQRMRELAVQAANGTLTEADRSALMEEFNQLRQGIAETVRNTEYNTQRVLEGYTGEFQVGANEGQTAQVNIPNLAPENLQANVNGENVNLNELDIRTAEGAQRAIEALDQMINQVSEARSNVGAFTNRLESAARNIANTMVNTTRSLSTIEDMDMARGVMEMTRLRLLQNFTTGVMAQSRVSSTAVLGLLRG